MAALSDFLENKLIDWLLRAQAIGITGASAGAGTGPTAVYPALIRATAGISPRSTAVTVGQTTVPVTGNGRMYRCSTAGTTGAGEPTWPTTTAGTVSDGGAVWTEMTTDFETNSSVVTTAEVTGNAYARPTITSGMSSTGWAGTQSSASTTASSGTGGTTSNNGVVSYATPTPSGWGVVAATILYDASTVGNALIYSVLTVPKTINSGDTVTFPAASLTVQIDN